MINREDELRNNLHDANQFLGEMVSYKNNLRGYYNTTVMVLNYNKICDIISMITDYIGYIYGDLQEEIQKGEQDD